MVSIGQGGGHNGNGGRGTRNKALDIKSKLIRPSPGKSPLATLNKSLAPTPSTVINPDTTPVSRRIDELNVHPEDEDYDYDSAPTLDIKNKSNKPILNKSLAPTSSPVINPDTTPDSGASMFESETGEEEPIEKDKDKDKDKEKTTKKPIPNYAVGQDDEVPGLDWSEEDYSYEETNTASGTSSAPTLDIKNKSNKPKLNKNKALTSSTVIKPASAPESGGSMFESETGEEEPKDKAKGKRLPGAHFKLSKNVCLFYLALHFQVKTTRRRRNRPSILEKK